MKKILPFILASVFWYGVFSFTKGDLNVENWGIILRGLFVLTLLASANSLITKK